MIKLGLRIISGDEAFYYLHDEGVFQGAVLTHVDDLILTGINAFIKKIRLGISDELNVSKVKRDKFKFTG